MLNGIMRGGKETLQGYIYRLKEVEVAVIGTNEWVKCYIQEGPETEHHVPIKTKT